DNYEGRGQQASSDVGEGRSDAGHGENIADPQERARDVPRKGAERGLDVAVDPAARRYAAPALRTADPDRADADCAGDECQGCVGSKGSGERARYRENS